MRTTASILGLVVGAATLSAQVPGPSFRDVINLQSVGSPAISPDGKAVAYTIRTTDWKDNRFDTEIWLWRQGAGSIQLTRSPKGSSTAPRWSPDGKWLGFLADRGDQQQLYVIGAMGGEAIRLTGLKDGVADYRWSPVGGKIALAATEPETEAATKAKALYGDFFMEENDYRMTHLWVMDADPTRWLGDSTGLPKPTRLTEGGAYTVGSFGWSPDGSRIAFDHRRDPLLHSGATTDISIVTVTNRAVMPLVVRIGSDGSPVWSPDGQWVAFTTSAGDTVSNFYKNSQLMKVAAGGGVPTRLAADFDEMIGSLLWTPDGMWFTAFNKTTSGFVQVDPVTGRAERDTGSPFVAIGGADVTRDGKWWVISAQKDGMSLPELYRGEVTGQGGPEKLTDMTAQIASWNVGQNEVVSWPSRDGTIIEGVLHKPKDWRPGKKYPLFVVIHGGPTGIDVPQPAPFYVYPIPQWVAKGALVLRPNYRGSAGYGEKFRSLNVRNLGVGDMWDVMSGVDHLIKNGMVDSTKMAAMGWSQGGYISAFLTTNTSRFKAISVGAGISNWVTYYVSTDIYPFTRQYLKATPWDDMAIYLKTSPMTAIKQARTPTLIQHGQFDWRVPIQNAYELNQGLLDQGVPSELMVYRGFGHGINKPKEQLAAVWHNWRWFGKYIFGEQVTIPLDEPPDAVIGVPTLDEITAARERLKGFAVRTPLVRWYEGPAEIYLKLETLQPIGSFKIRGARNALATAPAGALNAGVFTASAGNMAQGVAWCARDLGVPCTVVVPDHAPATKLEAIGRLGAAVIKVPFDRWWRVLQERRFEGLDGFFVHPVSDPAVIAGNGTIGLEIAEDLPDVDLVLAPYGGGGLSCGIATALRAVAPGARVVAVEPDTAAPLAASLAAGVPTPVNYVPTFIDGSGGKSVLAEMWPLARDLLGGSVPVSVAEVAEAIRLMAERVRIVAEGAGGLALAAARSGRVPGRKIVCVVSGGNLDAARLITILEGRVP